MTFCLKKILSDTTTTKTNNYSRPSSHNSSEQSSTENMPSPYAIPEKKVRIKLPKDKEEERKLLKSIRRPESSKELSIPSLVSPRRNTSIKEMILTRKINPKSSSESKKTELTRIPSGNDTPSPHTNPSTPHAIQVDDYNEEGLVKNMLSLSNEIVIASSEISPHKTDSPTLSQSPRDDFLVHDPLELPSLETLDSEQGIHNKISKSDKHRELKKGLFLSNDKPNSEPELEILPGIDVMRSQSTPRESTKDTKRKDKHKRKKNKNEEYEYDELSYIYTPPSSDTSATNTNNNKTSSPRYPEEHKNEDHTKWNQPQLPAHLTPRQQKILDVWNKFYVMYGRTIEPLHSNIK